ncbi:MAG: hypothetical protein K6E61_00310 [Bacteroidales bacterium]|nr:hypothetical protein [Bacteroidales bacterium]
MEAVQWYETASALIEDGIARDRQDGTDWYIKKWQIVSFKNDVLSVRINRDVFNLKKK